MLPTNKASPAISQIGLSSNAHLFESDLCSPIQKTKNSDGNEGLIFFIGDRFSLNSLTPKKRNKEGKMTNFNLIVDQKAIPETMTGCNKLCVKPKPQAKAR